MRQRGFERIDGGSAYRAPREHSAERRTGASSGDRRPLRAGQFPRTAWIIVASVATIAPSGWSFAPPVAQAANEDQPSSHSAADPQQIAGWIEQLNSPEYFVREHAQEQLSKAGVEAFDQLFAAAAGKNLEVAARARFLLNSTSPAFGRSDDPASVRDHLKDYGQQESDGRESRIRELSSLSAGAGLPALARLARYEPSEHLSRYAALQIIELTPSSDIDWNVVSSALRDELGSSQRPASQWLRLYLEGRTDSPEILTGVAQKWQAAIAQEADRTSATSERSPFLTPLRFHLAGLWQKLDNRTELVGLVQQIIADAPDSADEVRRLVRWLSSQEIWEPLDDIEQKFPDSFLDNAVLLYELAEARLKQGNNQAAEDLARRALEMGGDSVERHFQTSIICRQLNLPSWSERELRRVFEIGPDTNVYVIYGRIVLSESLHDRLEHGEAAEMLKAALAGIDQNVQEGSPERNPFQDEERLRSLRARQLYFAALDCREEDLARHEKLLDDALSVDPNEADALIALYRLPNPSAERQERTRRQIKDAAARFRKDIRESPDEPTAYNQFAWLIGNTEGDYQEAVRMSKKSLELRPDAAAYLDTLGRAYFAAGDLPNAIRSQRAALEREPGSGQMQRQLQEFLDAEKASRKPGDPPAGAPNNKSDDQNGEKAEKQPAADCSDNDGTPR